MGLEATAGVKVQGCRRAVANQLYKMVEFWVGTVAASEDAAFVVVPVLLTSWTAQHERTHVNIIKSFVFIVFWCVCILFNIYFLANKSALDVIK